MKIPQWVAPAVMLGGIATVVLVGPFAANAHQAAKPGTISTVNHHDSSTCHTDCGVNDDWTFADQVDNHTGCWQLTLSPTVAEFQCADGQRWTSHVPVN